MLRVVLSTLPEGIPVNSWAGLQAVRWHRKPRWVPMAKTRYNKEPVRKPVDVEEKEEMLRLYNMYRTQYRSVRKFLFAEVASKETQNTILSQSPEEEEDDMRNAIAINDEWNKEIVMIRDQRLEKRRNAKTEDVLERIEAKKLRDEERRRWADERVQHEIERSKHFIKRENLESAIEKALDNPVDFNFAIDLNLNIYRGKTTATPTEKLSRESEMQQQ
ncbi:small ribosomal subunit protein mS26 [Phlebotomus argentipes]|uniref:small ribosomal subunit protein mS26 n=1 Tax=Phlebotomus argentipes TaxID=94469 RepID=UPI002892CD42|nr:small ribosomal subunit protein mS26 [Phlebotomus argentipes]